MPRRNQMLMEIVADDSGSVSVLRENTDAIEKMDNAARDTTEGLERVNKQQQRMSLSGNRANMVLMDTGRIIQDLPYGLRGVANNIDPFVQSMQRARRETGSWSQVLSGLGSAMMGPAGIAIAISSVTSIMISAGPKIWEFFGLFEDGADKVSNAKKQMDLINDAIESELDSRLDPLNLEEQNEALTNAIDQLSGYNEIQEMNKQTLQDLIDPAQAWNDSLEAANQLTTAQSDATHAQVDAYEEIFKQQQNIDDQVLEILEKRRAEVQATMLVRRELDKIRGLQQRVNAEGLELVDRIDAVSIGASMDVETPDLSGMMAEQSPLSAGQVALGQEPVTQQQIDLLQEYGYQLENINELTAEQANNMIRQEKQAQALAETMQNQVIHGFSQMGTILGEVMSADFEGGVFQKFQLVFSQFLDTFGDQLIALGVGKIALDKLFSGPMGGPAAIAAGVALKAAAELTRRNAQNQLQSISNGGGRGSTGNVIAGYRGASAGQSGSGGPAVQFPSQVGVEFTDGQDNIVANGIMKMDRKGQNVYLGGGGNGS